MIEHVREEHFAGNEMSFCCSLEYCTSEFRLFDQLRVASSYKAQQKRVRLPIVPRPIYIDNSAKSYQYISIIDQLRELFLVPEVQKMIDDDYKGKFDMFEKQN